jgi:hypothetical protein
MARQRSAEYYGPYLLLAELEVHRHTGLPHIPGISTARLSGAWPMRKTYGVTPRPASCRSISSRWPSGAGVALPNLSSPFPNKGLPVLDSAYPGAAGVRPGGFPGADRSVAFGIWNIESVVQRLNEAWNRYQRPYLNADIEGAAAIFCCHFRTVFGTIPGWL